MARVPDGGGAVAESSQNTERKQRARMIATGDQVFKGVRRMGNKLQLLTAHHRVLHAKEHT